MTPCDFCAAPATVRYEARPSTTTATVTQAMTGRRVTITTAFADADWHACETCRRLVASGRRDELAARSVARFVADFPNMADGLTATQAERQRREVAATVRRLHDDFWRSRLGAPESLAATEGRAA